MGYYVYMSGPDESKYDRVRAAAETLAEEIEMLVPDQWAGWVAYVLETLDEVGTDFFEQVLRETDECIQVRLEHGRW